MTRYVVDNLTGQQYATFKTAIGQTLQGVQTTSNTSPPGQPSWFISTGSSTSYLNASLQIFNYVTQSNQRFRFVVQSNPLGPYWYQIQLYDSSGSSVVQQGNLTVQVYDTSGNIIKQTLIQDTSSRAAISGTNTGGGGLTQNTLTYTFGDPGEEFVTDPGDVIRIYFQPTQSGQNGVYAPASNIFLSCELLSPSSGPTQ